MRVLTQPVQSVSPPDTEKPTRLRRTSVVIPLHNAERWVAQTIRSILSQSYDHELLEVVVVDDGSIDQSAQVASRELAKGDVRWHLIQTANHGPSAARNLGWRNTTGEWIQFLDSDDVLDPTKLSVQLSTANSRPETAVLYSNWQRLGLATRAWEPSGRVHSPTIGGDALVSLLRSDLFIPMGSHLIQRTWLETVQGFDERHWLIEDVELLIKIAMAGGRFSKIYSDQPLFFYRHRPGASLSQRSRREFIEGCIRNAKLVERHWDARGELTPRRKQTLVEAYLQAARYFAAVDWQAFENTVADIEALQTNFIPSGPLHLSIVSRFLGYRRAERVATLYRRAKAHLKG
jgi:glycosyltransferase involved in cell wall biosynthesis